MEISLRSQEEEVHFLNNQQVDGDIVPITTSYDVMPML